MNKIIFNNGIEVEINSIRRANNLVTVTGNIPRNTNGFKLQREINPTELLDYSDFTTIYKANTDGITFSNDGSIYTKTVTVKVVWNDSDDYDGIRPESVDVEVSKDGVALETVTLSPENEWQKSYSDSVDIPTYSVDGEGIQAYEKTVSGLTVSYYHEADIPVPPPTPDLEQRVSDLETDMSNLNHVIGGIVE